MGNGVGGVDTFIAIFFLFAALSLHGQNTVTPNVSGIVFVKKGGAGTGTGSSWADACGELADAILSANTNPDIKEIWVAEGTYTPLYNTGIAQSGTWPAPGERDRTFLITSDVKIYGGFVGTEEALDDRIVTPTTEGIPMFEAVTTLSGVIGTTGTAEDSVYHVVVAVGTSNTNRISPLLDGVTITGGNNSDLANDYDRTTVKGEEVWRSEGAGLYGRYTNMLISNVTLSGNSAKYSGGGIINNYSSPKLTNVTLSGNSTKYYGGGIINNYSSPVLTNVTLSGNSADRGGGIYNYYSSPVLTNVTLSGNNAGWGGGGIYNDSSSPALTNVTLSGNNAGWGGGGIYNDSSSPVLTNVTLSGNNAEWHGGGICNNYGHITLNNSIIAGNSATTSAPDIWIFDNQFTSITANYSLIGDTAGCNKLPIFGEGSKVNKPANMIFVDWANGNYQLMMGSPAGNTGKDSLYLVAIGIPPAQHEGYDWSNEKDLAGNPRRNNGRIDMGAYEVQLTPNGRGILYVKKGATGTGSSWADACGELADAILSANNSTNIDYIWVAEGIYTPLYNIGIEKHDDFSAPGERDKTFLITKQVSIYGGFPENANDNEHDSIQSREWITNADGIVLPKHHTILSGVIGNTGTVADSVYHVVVAMGTSNTNRIFPRLDGVTITGGNSSDLTVADDRTTIKGEEVRRSEGTGIYSRYTNMQISNVTLSGNSADYGGGIFNNYSSPKLTHVALSGNSAKTSGGGIYNFSSSPVLTNVTLSGNSAKTSGGGIYNLSSSPVLTNVTLNENSANYGGGIFNNYFSSPLLTNVTLSGNSAEYGGGIFNDINSSPLLTNVTLSGNSANYGGGIYNINYSSPILTNVTISENSADRGGGIFNTYYSSPVLTNVTISENSAEYGGGIHNNRGHVKLNNSIIAGNSATSSAPDILTYDKQFTSITANYSLIGDTAGCNKLPIFGEGSKVNKPANMIFVDWANGNYQLMMGSPAGNTGKDSLYLVAIGIPPAQHEGYDWSNEKDLAGNPRRNNGRIDMGAYEFAMWLHYAVACNDNAVIALPYGECEMEGVLAPPTVITLPDSAEYYGAIVTHNLPQSLTRDTYRVKWSVYTDDNYLIDTCIQWVVVNLALCGEQDTVWSIPPQGDIEDLTFTIDSLVAEDHQGTRYPTVRIGCDCWTARNLTSTQYADGTPVEGYFVYVADRYPDTAANRSLFGLLYTYEAALNICPEGWALPSVVHYERLIPFGSDALRMPDSWLDDHTATNSTGFSALPAGFYNDLTSSYYYLLGDAYFWTSEQANVSLGQVAHIRYLCPVLEFKEFSISRGASVRCVRVEN